MLCWFLPYNINQPFCCCSVAKSCSALKTSWAVACQVPLVSLLIFHLQGKYGSSWVAQKIHQQVPIHMPWPPSHTPTHIYCFHTTYSGEIWSDLSDSGPGFMFSEPDEYFTPRMKIRYILLWLLIWCLGPDVFCSLCVNEPQALGSHIVHCS